jgi:hypothetical protein
MQTTLTSKRDQLNDQIAAAEIGQDVRSLVAARDYYNRQIDQQMVARLTADRTQNRADARRYWKRAKK